MTLKNRLYLASLLTPAFWLVFLWIFFVSPSAALFSIPIVLLQSLAMAYVSAYCVTLFVARLSRFSNQTSRTSDPR